MYRGSGDFRLSNVSTEPGTNEELQAPERRGVAHRDDVDRSIGDCRSRRDEEAAAESRTVGDNKRAVLLHRRRRVVTDLDRGPQSTIRPEYGQRRRDVKQRTAQS